jgi:shikimate dehydrogenase
MHSPLQEIVALLGYPVAGNPTQYMIERAFSRCGLDWRYLTLEVAPENLADAVRGMRAMGFRGGNLTMPHKIAVLPLLDQITDSARLMGAVNCWSRHGDRLIGDNTDGKGFLQTLRGRIDPAGRRFVVLGAGGAARAIAVELALAGAAEILVVNRDLQRGESLSKLIAEQSHVQAHAIPWHGDFSVPSETDVLVNATSIGMGNPNTRVPIALDSLRPGMIVADVIVNPPNTRLLREAAQQGCPTLDGLGMLACQGAIGFKIWTGLECDPAAMREAAEEFLGI